jgi:hypothetical protein
MQASELTCCTGQMLRGAVFALEDIDMNDAVDEIYALEVIMAITQFLFHVLIYTYVFQAVLVRFETRML